MLTNDQKLKRGKHEDVREQALIERELCHLEKSLPHGSGINGEWYLTYIKRGKKFYASNHYEAMNEQGTYCHIYDFTLTLEKVELTMQEWETLDNQAAKMGKEPKNIRPNKFEITRLNFHGQREYACCGSGLKDYLWQTVQEGLDYAYEQEEA